MTNQALLIMREENQIIVFGLNISFRKILAVILVQELWLIILILINTDKLGINYRKIPED